MEALLRFVIGGTVAVSVWLLSKHAGTGLAGRLMTGPWITGLSLYFVYASLGAVTAGGVAKAGLPGLLPIAAFLAVMCWCFGQGWSFWPSFALSFGIWVVGALVLQFYDKSWFETAAAIVVACAAVLGTRTRFARKWFMYEDQRTGEIELDESRIATAIVLVLCIVVPCIVFAIDHNVKHAFLGLWYTALAIFVVAAFFRPTVEFITGKPIRR
jgi:uncharacterized membrane protein (GlpM family)